MEPKELREQAQRWRARAPAQDKETAEALTDAATSFEGLAEDKEKATAKPEKPGEFIHRAYDPRDKKK
jgi:hypothetical protein